VKYRVSQVDLTSVNTTSRLNFVYLPSSNQRKRNAEQKYVQPEENHENKEHSSRPWPCTRSGGLLVAGVRAGFRRARQGSDREVLSVEAAVFSLRGETVSSTRLLGRYALAHFVFDGRGRLWCEAWTEGRLCIR